MRLHLKAICIESDTACKFYANTEQPAMHDQPLKKTVDDVLWEGGQHNRSTGHRVLLHGNIGRDNHE